MGIHVKKNLYELSFFPQCKTFFKKHKFKIFGVSIPLIFLCFSTAADKNLQYELRYPFARMNARQESPT